MGLVLVINKSYIEVCMCNLYAKLSMMSRKLGCTSGRKGYITGIQFSAEDMEKHLIEPHSLHPKWNYSILGEP